LGNHLKEGLLTAQKNEITEYHVYQNLAVREKISSFS